jgi:hypothetical protein
LEAFATRRREVLKQALGLNFKRYPSDATFLDLFHTVPGLLTLSSGWS